MRGAQDKARRTLAGSPWILHRVWKAAIRGAVVCIVMLPLGVGIAMGDERDAIFSAVRVYTIAVYARDYAEAYRWIATADRRLKSLADYEQDNEAFKGPSLILARRLAQEIVIRDMVVHHQGDQANVRAQLSLPNANAEEVSRLLFATGGFDEVPPHELRERMAKLETLIASGALPKLDVEETWTLVLDPEGWRVFLDWGSGVRIHFATQVPKDLNVTATFDRAEALTPRGETVRLRLTVRNHGAGPVRLKVVHRVGPAAYTVKLDLVQCGFLFPTDVAKGGVEESLVVYFVDGDLPKDVERLRVTLEFQRVE